MAVMPRRILRRTPLAEDSLPQDWHPVLRRVYRNRGISTVADTELDLQKLLPFQALRGLDAAVTLLAQALREHWHICIVGDYDVDGATSTALMISALRAFGATQLSYLVPDRFRFGYGLTPEIVALAAERRPGLLITVDNGIASVEGVAAARTAGMRVLITDHHLPGSVLPEADAIVNPNQPGCNFSSKALAGVGVAFYLLIALRAHLRNLGAGDGPHLAAYLDLVALGTVADVVALDHNNRILVQQGLRLIRAGRCRPGILALLQIAGRDYRQITAADLGFAVGPRLNAAGRLEDMSLGVACLLSDSDASATQQAQQLDQLNRARREIQQQMQEEALLAVQSLNTHQLPYGVCLYDPGWHQGITGLVAGKVKDQHHRPTIAFAPADEQGSTLKGSARSITGFHVRDALDAIATQHPGLISKFGGHAMAAGLSLERSKLEVFQTAFDQEARRWLKPEHIEAVIETDGELKTGDFSLALATQLRDAGPWGQAFPEPVFDGVFDVLEQRIVGERHLKLRLKPAGGGATLEAIAFSQESLCPTGTVRATYRLDINEYRGLCSLQAVVESLEPVDQGAGAGAR